MCLRLLKLPAQYLVKKVGKNFSIPTFSAAVLSGIKILYPVLPFLIRFTFCWMSLGIENVKVISFTGQLVLPHWSNFAEVQIRPMRVDLSPGKRNYFAVFYSLGHQRKAKKIDYLNFVKPN